MQYVKNAVPTYPSFSEMKPETPPFFFRHNKKK